MAFSGNTTSNLSELMQSYYDKMLLKRVSEQVVMQQFGQKKPLPKGEGKTITFTRYSNLAVATTALTEGVNPSGSNLSATNVSAQVAEYGDYVKISSLVDLTSLDLHIKEKIPILSTQMAETIDRLIMNEVAPNATAQVVSTASDQASIVASDVLTMTDVRKARRKLQDNKATKYGDGYYVLVVDPYTLYDLQSDSTWVDSAKYSDVTRLYTGEAGKWFGCRVVMTTLPFRTAVGNSTYSSSGAVHWNIMLGQEEYGVTKLSGGEKKIIVKTPGPQDTGNPLNRYSTAGWYCTFVTKTLNSNFGIAIKTGATA